MKIDHKTQNGKILLKENVRKFRKITNIPIAPYIDSSNKSLGLNMAKSKLVYQPSSRDLRTNDLIDTLEELPFDVLIATYEKKYGKVIPDKCDLETPLLNEKYPCKSEKNSLKKIQDIRNYELARQIAEAKSQKIALVFGGTHYEEIK